MPFQKMLDLMASYDAASVGSPGRIELGAKIDKEASRLSERDYWKVVIAYEKKKENN